MRSRDETPRPGKDSHHAAIRTEDLGMLVACSMRYALGRQSSAPTDVASRVQTYWPVLTPRWRIVIKHDLETELDRHPSLPDRRTWLNLATWIRGQDEKAKQRAASS